MRRRRILRFPFPQTLPLQFGDFFNELLHLLIATHGLKNPFLPGFGNTGLAQFPLLLLHQVQGVMKVASGTTTVGLAAFAGAWVQSATQEPSSGGQLRDGGTEAALFGRQFGTSDHGLYDKGRSYLYNFNIQDTYARKSG